MPLSFSYSTAATAGSRKDPDSPAVSTITEPNNAETTAAATGLTATTAEDHAETHASQCKCLLENKIGIIFLFFDLNRCFGCSKEPSH